MNQRKRRYVGGICGVLFLAAAAGGVRAEDATYAVRLVRPYKVGEKYALTAKVQQTHAMREEVDGKEILSDAGDFKYSVEGVWTVTAIDAKGRESSFHVAIGKFQCSKDGAAAAEVLAAGTEVDCVYKEGKAEFTGSKGALSEAATDALAAVFTASREKTEDDMYGTAGAKKIGESWGVNAKAMAENARRMGCSWIRRKFRGR